MVWSSVPSITVLTTVGIILVLGIQSVEFFSHAHVGLFEFLFGTELKPDASRPGSGSSRCSGAPSWSPLAPR